MKVNNYFNAHNLNQLAGYNVYQMKIILPK